uniref:J domain-containing protein n=1 Tax=viral metagenome TaxID=1070528 RepID=A0A6C0CQV0_9ZZZZ
MSFEEIDLNIDNYSLNDLLELFKIPFDFEEEDLKRVKKTVLMTHPDKSNLDKEVFLFFCKAYKLIYSVYNFRNRSEQDTCVDRVYTTREIDNEKDENIGKTLRDFSKKKDFNKFFNEMFEKNYMKAESTSGGYGSWLKEENEVIEATSIDDMNEQIEKRKKDLRALVVVEDLEEVGYGGGSSHSNLTGRRPTYYESNMFGNLQYDDVQRAYTESVVPVTHEDYQNKKKFGSIEEMQRFRKEDYEKNFTPQEHSSRLKENRKREEMLTAERAYSLAKEHEQSKKANKGFISGLLRITNDR